MGFSFIYTMETDALANELIQNLRCSGCKRSSPLIRGFLIRMFPPLFLIIFVDAVRIRAGPSRAVALKINMPVHAKFEKFTKDTLSNYVENNV